MSEFTQEVGYNGQNATALVTSSRSRFAVGGRVTLPNYKPIPTLTAKQVARFWSYVEKTDSCWMWRGTIDRNGYGWFSIDSSIYRAHRVVYVLVKGPFDWTLTLDHLCRVRHCVNPDHLEPVMSAVNTLRGEGSSARRSRQTHCKNGHEFTPENTKLDTKGHRTCRECGRIYWRRLWALGRLRSRFVKRVRGRKP